MGSKNHEIVPLQLIVQISGLRNGGVNKLVGSLAKRNLVAKVQNAKCGDLDSIIMAPIQPENFLIR
jgi:RIO-like serine/threonine protein kinase